MSEGEERAAREAAYRLGGNLAAAELFELFEVDRCLACLGLAGISVQLPAITFHDAGDPTRSWKTPGKVSEVKCPECDAEGYVVAYDQQSGRFGALALRPARPADRRRWEWMLEKRSTEPRSPLDELVGLARPRPARRR